MFEALMFSKFLSEMVRCRLGDTLPVCQWIEAFSKSTYDFSLVDIGDRLRLAVWTISFSDFLRALINAARGELDSTVAVPAF